MKSIAAKTIAPMLGTALALSALVWAGGPRSADAGVDVWTPTGPYGGSVFVLATDPRTPTTLYTGTRVGVFKSTDGEGTWSDTGLAATVVALAIDPGTPNIVYAGTAGGGVLKSVDGGGTWSTLNTGLTTLYVKALAVDPLAPSTLYAGTLQQSTGGGSAPAS